MQNFSRSEKKRIVSQFVAAINGADLNALEQLCQTYNTCAIRGRFPDLKVDDDRDRRTTVLGYVFMKADENPDDHNLGVVARYMAAMDSYRAYSHREEHKGMPCPVLKDYMAHLV